MKKLSIVIILVILLFISACNGKNRINISRIPDSYYENIESISYTSIDYLGGYNTIKTIDLNENQVIVKEGFPGSEEISYSYQLDNSNILDFLKEFKRTGVLDLKKEYKKLLPVMDGGGWKLDIKFKDGTEKNSKGSNAGPYEIFKDADEVFYSYFKASIFGRLDSSYYEIPSLECYLKYDNKTVNSFINYFEYVWLHKEVSNIPSVDDIRFLQHFIFNKDTTYQFIFNKKEIKSYKYYVLDALGEEVLYTSQEHIFSNEEDNASIDLELNRIYKITCEYEKGEVTYFYSTHLIDDSVLPNNFQVSFYWSKGNNAASISLSKDNSTYFIDGSSRPLLIDEESLYQIFKAIYALQLDDEQLVDYNHVYGENNPSFKFYYRYYGIVKTITFDDLKYLEKYEEDKLTEANILLDKIYAIYSTYLQKDFERKYLDKIPS